MNIKKHLENALIKRIVVEISSTSKKQMACIKELMREYKIETKIKSNDKVGFTAPYWIEKNRNQRLYGLRE